MKIELPGVASPKILSLDGLLEWRRRERSAGRTVVHCHGCFDIVHPGHVLHLQHARSLGDVLVVSLSGDGHVNKGPARPLVPQELRAASLAALQCVDAVFVNEEPTAVGLLGRLAPDVYVKGHEYQHSTDPRFLAERAAVESAGGRVAFTSGDIVLSSTALIRDLSDDPDAVDPFERHKLVLYRHRHGLSGGALRDVVRQMAGRRVVVVGDYIRDRYHLCDATGVSSEGPMLSLSALETREYDGGAAVIARHCASLGARVSLVTTLAGDEASRGVVGRLHAEGIAVAAFETRRTVVTKNRYLVDAQKVMKVDEGSPAPLDSRALESVAAAVVELATGADAVIFADFGYGTVTDGLLERVLPVLRPIVPVIAADVSGRRGSLMRFKGVDLVSPTERELRDAAGDFASGLNAVVWNYLEATGARNAMVTLGRQGLVAFDRPDAAPGARLRGEHLPALCPHAVDPLGCGDALLATATLALAAGGGLQAAALLGSIAAAFEAGRLGNVPVPLEALLGHPMLADAAVPAARLAG